LVARRDFLGAAAAFVAVAPVRQQDTAVAPLWQPGMVGRSRERVTDYENDPFIIGIESRMRCTCGCGLDVYTCRTTDFACTYSPERHREVVALVEQDKTAEEILAYFVAEYGESILMAPPKTGFNLAGYLLPGILITVVGIVMGWVLMRRHRLGEALPIDVRGDVSNLSDEDATRLQQELDGLEG
jgi:cytochrome c-type biogenesis protein CcmH